MDVTKKKNKCSSRKVMTQISLNIKHTFIYYTGNTLIRLGGTNVARARLALVFAGWSVHFVDFIIQLPIKLKLSPGMRFPTV